MKKYIPFIVLFLVGVLIGWLPKGRLQKETIVEKRDTLIIRDTVKEYKPVPVEVVKEKWKTQLVEVKDTVRIHDTLYLNLPIEKKVYKKEDYYAEVTGYNPSLTYIEVYPKTVYVTETIRRKDKCNYLSVGAEACYIGTVYIPIYLEYERMLHKNFSIYGRIAYDLPSKSIGGGIGVRAQVGWWKRR